MKKFLLFALSIVLFASCEQKETPQQRAGFLEGAANFRDLGGYKTGDGKATKWKTLFRSQKLSQLTDADVSTLRAMKIKTVVDFRDDEEVRKDPSRLPESANMVRLPIDAGSHDSTRTIMQQIMSGELDSLQCTGFMETANRRFCTEFTEQYKDFFKILLDKNNYPVVFHCTAGKDRTGFAAAMVLSALGVDWNTIMSDYLLTNEYLKPSSLEMFTNVPEQALPVVKMMSGVKASYLNAAKDEIEKQYGSIDHYLQQALGVGETEKATLRKILEK